MAGEAEVLNDLDGWNDVSQKLLLFELIEISLRLSRALSWQIVVVLRANSCHHFSSCGELLKGPFVFLFFLFFLLLHR